MMMIARALLTVAIHSYVKGASGKIGNPSSFSSSSDELSYLVSSSVWETTEYYYCKEGTQALKSDYASNTTDCEQNWAVESIPIGSFMSGGVECHSPCINVTAGKIIITGCVNTTLTVICSQGHVTENRTYFLGIQMNFSPLQNFKKRDRYGIWACLTLLLLLIAGFAIQRCTCQCHRLGNTRPIQL